MKNIAKEEVRRAFILLKNGKSIVNLLVSDVMSGSEKAVHRIWKGLVAAC